MGCWCVTVLLTLQRCNKWNPPPQYHYHLSVHFLISQISRCLLVSWKWRCLIKTIVSKPLKASVLHSVILRLHHLSAP